MDRDEAMEVEGNEAVVNYAVGGHKEVEQKEVNGVEAVEKIMRWKKWILTKLRKLVKRNVKLASVVNLGVIDICIWRKQCLKC